MLAAIVVSGIASALCLRGLELELKIPEHIFAGTQVPGTLSVRNPRRGIPSLSISATPAEKGKERKPWSWAAPPFPVPPCSPPDRQRLQLPDARPPLPHVDS